MGKAATVFVIGTVATLAIAAILVITHHKLAAGAVIVASPFPCPSGLPC